MRSGEDFTKEILAAAEKAIGYTFRDRELLTTCFTHRSYASVAHVKDNERLEFLGDAVLELVVSEKLYEEYPEKSEGELTKLRADYVSKTALKNLCEREKFWEFLRYSGDFKNNLGDKPIESLPEAIIGAIYLDGGKEAAQAFIWRFVSPAGTVNYKGRLQEYVQEGDDKTLPSYETLESAEENKFRVRVTALGKSAEGCGKNTAEAETEAAKRLLEILRGKA